MKQRKLEESALKAFYHDCFVTDQVHDFIKLAPSIDRDKVVVDVGGGCGFFAKRLTIECGVEVRVLDMDPKSVYECEKSGVPAELGDATNPVVKGDESVVCFNLILHHMVAGSELETRELQKKVLSVWKGKVDAMFINEYIYESLLSNLSGALIYRITKSKVLSTICHFVSKVIPVFKANTFGVGVRFRAHNEWVELFEEIGLNVVASEIGKPEKVAFPLRSLFIRKIRRDSFLLKGS